MMEGCRLSCSGTNCCRWRYVQGDEASDKEEARDVALDKKLDVALVSSKRTFQRYVGCVRHWMSYREASSSR